MSILTIWLGTCFLITCAIFKLVKRATTRQPTTREMYEDEIFDTRERIAVAKDASERVYWEAHLHVLEREIKRLNGGF